MNKSKLSIAFVLSSMSAVLIVITAGSSVLFPDVYQEGAISSGFNRAGWQGNDWVTLLVALPLLIGALIFAQRGSLRARLGWMGLLYYTLYNDSFYLFGAAINWLFPLYVALFTLSALALIFALASADINGFGQYFQFKASVRWISLFMLFFAALLLMTWSAQWVSFVAAGSSDAGKGDFIRTVAGIDLLLLGSGMLLGAFWLWKRKPWGYVIATILNVCFALYALVLTVGSFTQDVAGVKGATAEVPIWLFLGLACLAASLILLGNVRERSLP